MNPYSSFYSEKGFLAKRRCGTVGNLVYLRYIGLLHKGQVTPRPLPASLFLLPHAHRCLWCPLIFVVTPPAGCCVENINTFNFILI
jgi:hypothetical protein